MTMLIATITMAVAGSLGQRQAVDDSNKDGRSETFTYHAVMLVYII